MEGVATSAAGAATNTCRGPRPAPVDPGTGSRLDRERLRAVQAGQWAAQGQAWTAQVRAARERLRQEHAQRAEYWDAFRDGQVTAWTTRDRSIRPAHVTDFPLVAQQWAPVNGAPDTVTASDMGKPLWTCPWHPDGFRSTVKDRVQKGTRCPECNKIGTVADVGALRDQLDNPLHQTPSLGAHDRVGWVHRTWALDPTTGQWQPWEHRFDAAVKDRWVQADGCRVCAGYVVDASTSLRRWHPDVAAELVDPSLADTLAPTTRTTAEWHCSNDPDHPDYPATVQNRTAGGTTCSKCAGTQPERQIRICAELTALGLVVPPTVRDSRLAFGQADLGPHRLRLPPAIQTLHGRRYNEEEVDILLAVAGHQVAIEYDGEYFHDPANVANARVREQKKEAVLASLNVPVLRIREGRLPAVQAAGVDSLPVPSRGSVFGVVVDILNWLETTHDWTSPGADAYRAGGSTVAAASAEEYFATIGKEKKPRRKPAPQPKKVRQPRHPFTPGQRINALTVLTGPKHFPDAPAPSDRWRYQVICDCGLTRWFNHWTLTNQAPQTCGVHPHTGIDRTGQELHPDQSARDAATLT